jgi:hypothetical protein
MLSLLAIQVQVSVQGIYLLYTGSVRSSYHLGVLRNRCAALDKSITQLTLPCRLIIIDKLSNCKASSSSSLSTIAIDSRFGTNLFSLRPQPGTVPKRHGFSLLVSMLRLGIELSHRRPLPLLLLLPPLPPLRCHCDATAMVMPW